MFSSNCWYSKIVVNRSPVAGEIAYAKYTPGKFLDARHPDVSHENEVNALGIIAGNRLLPLSLAREARAAGVSSLVAVSLESETNPDLS